MFDNGKIVMKAEATLLRNPILEAWTQPQSSKSYYFILEWLHVWAVK